MPDGEDDVSAYQILASSVRRLNQQIEERKRTDDQRYKEMSDQLDKVSSLRRTVFEIKEALEEFDFKNVPPRQRHGFPFLMDWWSDRGDRAKDWRYYLPLILGFLGPIIGGVVVVFVTHGR